MTQKGMKQLATDEIWAKQNGMTYGLHDKWIKIWLVLNVIIWMILLWMNEKLCEVIKQELRCIYLNNWQIKYCATCTLMVCREWQERHGHEQKS